MELVGSTPGPSQGPVYIYHGVSNLKELKDLNLFGANLFFNGSFDIKDLQDVDLVGASVFLNGALQVRVLTTQEEKSLTFGRQRLRWSALEDPTSP